MIAIHPAEPGDLEVIHQLAYDIWPFSYGEILSVPQLQYMLENFYSLSSLQNQVTVLKHQFLIVRENDVPVGFASFSMHKDDPAIYHLHKIYVLPGEQGKSIGRQILAFIIKQIKMEGAVSLQLNVNRHNKAVVFYEKQGFTTIREEDIDIGNGYFMNDYVMELKW